MHNTSLSGARTTSYSDENNEECGKHSWVKTVFASEREAGIWGWKAPQV